MEEIYKPIKGYEGLYEVSNFGNVKNRFEKILIPSKDYCYRVSLCKNNKKKTQKIHRLVAETFLNKQVHHIDVNHIDGDRYNNRVDNLEWCTRSHNIQHSHDNGLQICDPVVNPNYAQKLNLEEVLEIRRLRHSGVKQHILSKMFGVSQSNISGIVNKTYWKNA